MFSVLITNRYPVDFVTSSTAEMVFNTRIAAEMYIENSEIHHPGRFSYQIKEKEKIMDEKLTLKNFKAELKTLLAKYDAEIGFTASDGSDFYGLSGEKLVVTLKGKKESKLTGGYWLRARDL